MSDRKMDDRKNSDKKQTTPHDSKRNGVSTLGSPGNRSEKPDGAKDKLPRKSMMANIKVTDTEKVAPESEKSPNAKEDQNITSDPKLNNPRSVTDIDEKDNTQNNHEGHTKNDTTSQSRKSHHSSKRKNDLKGK